MKFVVIVLSVFLFCLQANALVNGVSSVATGESRIDITTQIEGGKIEPNENKASFQNADIKTNHLKYTYGLDSFSVFSVPNLSVSYSQFTSNEERVGNTLFYAADKGSVLTLGFSAELLHDPNRQFGFYINVTPSSNYNKKKFSNSRIDTFSFGVNSLFNLSAEIFQKSLIHYASGDGQDQNSSLAVDSGFGFRLSKWAQFPLVLSTTLFLEADLKDRFDASYDAAFSALGTTDRIRAFKYGTLLGLSGNVTDSVSVSFDYLQKLGGYDARSTQISKL